MSLIPDKKAIILFNCTTNVVGGGIKNSVLFILETIADPFEFRWYYAISSEVAMALKNEDFELNSDFIVFEDSPARSKKSRLRLLKLSQDVNAKMVYTMAGPAYVKFSVPHLLGISNAYITHVKMDVLNLYSTSQRMNMILRSLYQLYKCRDADHYVFQTETARKNFCKRSGTNPIATSVIGNAFDARMKKNIFGKSSSNNQPNNTINILCPGANYSHKAFQFIPKIAKELRELTNSNFKFILTLPNSNLLDFITTKAEEMGVAEQIVNIGPYSYSEVTKIYSTANIVFVPSLLETFTATYLEAMSVEKILVVSNRDFASEVCGDYAVYVNPINALETAETFHNIIENFDNFKPNIELGNRILEGFGDQKQRYRKLIALMKDILIK